MSIFDLPTIDPNSFKAPVPVNTAPNVPDTSDRSNAFVSGLKVGGLGLAAGAAGFGSNIAKLVGANDTSASLGQAAADFNKSATDVGRPDLDDKSWLSSDFGGKLAYAAGQAIPGIAAIGGAAALAPEALGVEAGGVAARVGSYLPKLLGGGEGVGAARAGAGLLGGAAISVPTTVGDLTNDQAQRDGGLTYGGAVKALGLGIPAGVAGALAPGEAALIAKGAGGAAGALAEKLGGGAVGNFVDHGLKNAALGAVGGAAQTAAAQALDPTTTTSQKISAVVESAAGGAVAGGLIGGTFGAAFGHSSAADQQSQLDSVMKPLGLDPADPSAGVKPPEPVPPASPAGGGEAATSATPTPEGPGLVQPPAPQADAAPKTVIQQALEDAGITKFSTKGEFGKFVEASTAQSLPELYNEIDKAGDVEALAGGRLFGKLANHVGNAIPDLEGQLARERAAPEPDQAAIDRLNTQLGTRDAAHQLPGARPPEPAPAEVMPTAAEGAPPVAVPGGAPPVPREAAAGRMITAPLFEGDIPELTPTDRASSPSVPTDTQVQPSGGVKTLGPDLVAPLPPLEAGSERAPATADSRPPDAGAGVTPDAGPLSITDKVLAVARASVGDKGGEVDIASLRAALPDISSKDLDNALREIHTDDTDNTLTQNPKGQRNGVDGVSVQGQGRFQKLELEPQETPGAAEVGSAAPEAGADQSGSPAPAGGGDATGEPATGASAAQAETTGQQGATQPANQGAAPSIVTPEAKAEATAVKLAPQPVAEPSPAQQVQTATKTKAVGNIIAADPTVSTAGKDVVQKLRKQSRAKTAMIETPNGDQIPTDAVGTTPVDLAQATATSTDPLVSAGSPDILLKIPSDRVPGVVDTHPILPREQVDAHVAKFVAKLRPEFQDRIHVVDNPSELPRSVLDRGAAQNHDFSTNTGLYHDGQVYVIANQMRNLGEVEDTLSHEVWGHLGTSLRFDRTSDFGSAMARVFDKIDGPEGGGFERAARKAGVWDQDEDGHNLVSGAGIKSYIPHIFPEGVDRATPLQKAIAVDELMAHQAGQVPSKLDGVISSFQIQAKRAIANTLRRAGMTNFARRFETFGQPEMAKWLADSRAALRQQPRPGDIDLAALSSDPRQFIHDMDPLGAAPFMSRLSAQQRDAQGLHGLVGSVADKIAENKVYTKVILPGVVAPAREAVRGFKALTAPATEMAETGKRLGMHGLQDHLDAEKRKGVISTRWSQTAGVVHQAATNLGGVDRVQYGRANKLMATMTSEGILPWKPFEDHNWLIEGRKPEDVLASKAKHAEAQQLWNSLGQATKGGRKTDGQQVVRDHVALSQADWLIGRAAAAHDIGSTQFGDHADFGQHPGDAYTTRNDLHGNIHATLSYAQAEFDRMQAALKAVSTGEGTKPENLGSPTYEALARLIRENEDGHQTAIQEGPYFHLGRQGDYTVSGRVKAQLDGEGKPIGKPDPAALDAIKAQLEKQFPQVTFGASDENAAFFTKFKSQEEAENFHRLFVEGGALHEHIDQEHGTAARKISDVNPASAVTPLLQRQIDGVAARYNAELEGLDPTRDADAIKALAAERDKTVGSIRATMNDIMSPTRSIQARRDGVQGFNTDMLVNQQIPSKVTANAIGTSATHVEQANGLAQARRAIDASARRGDDQAVTRTARMQRVYDDFQKRNDASVKRVDNSFLSWLKSGLHSFQLAASPAYAIMNISQLGTLGLPELARFHGFAKSSAAMVRALPQAFRVMEAMVAKLPQADGTRGRSIVHGGITNEVLRRATSDADTHKFLQDVTNMGGHELGSFTAHDAGLQIGALNRGARWLHYANSVPLLAETFCRVLTGLASKHLYENATGAAAESMRNQFASREAYAMHSIEQSCLEWGSYNTSRFMTAGGPLGPLSPTVFQFHGFVPKIVAKVYREALNGYTNRLSDSVKDPVQLAAMRKEARAFTNAHLASVMAMSGTMGLPLLGTALGAATRVSGFTGNQPVDFQAGFRDFLANTFGKQAGEVIAHGIPRYVGTDFSELGDDNWVPFASLIEDRQKFEDASKDYLSRAWGSGVGAAVNFVAAARDMSEGRFMEAGARAMPTAIKNVVRAVQIEQRGYVNSKGEQIPVQGVSRDAEAVKQLFGIQSGQLAEERERQNDLSGLLEDRKQITQRIGQKLLLSHNTGDQAGYRAAIAEATNFSKDNPGKGIMSSLGPMIQQAAKTSALGQRTGVLGLDPKDRRARELTGF